MAESRDRLVSPAEIAARRGSGALRAFQEEPTAPRGGIGRGRASGRRSTLGGRENRPLLGTGRRGRSVLPAWYPRAPLRDVTAVVRAIERRRARLGEVEGQQMERPVAQDQTELDSSLSLLGAWPNRDASLMSLNPSSCCPPSVGKVLKTLLNEREKRVRTLMSMR